MRLMMSRMEVSSPPGVSISRTTAAALVCSARAMTRSTNPATTGLIIPLTGATRTEPVLWASAPCTSNPRPASMRASHSKDRLTIQIVHRHAPCREDKTSPKDLPKYVKMGIASGHNREYR